jgi:tetratricopeptide (TPR) repeat protein
MQKYDNALQDFNLLIKLNGKNKEALARRGETYRLMKRYKEALKDLDRSIEFDSEYLPAIFSRALIYGTLGNYTEALKNFDFLSKLCPEATGMIEELKQYLE